jgi:mono/diheme cytochrome c family protein
LRGGLLGTEPLHWNGDMKDFRSLMKEVFVGRMSGFSPSATEADALSHFLDRQPALHAEATDKAAADRGKELFESQEVGCSGCHAGAHLTNNQTENVGTGADLQVPSLKGVRFRTPLMHDGCAANLSERFTKKDCGGGDKHGKTSQLSAAQIGDLTAYLETL